MENVKQKLKREILELFCGVGHGVIDCDTETELKLDEAIDLAIAERDSQIKEAFIKEFFASGERWYNYGFENEDEIETALMQVEQEWEDIINLINSKK